MGRCPVGPDGGTPAGLLVQDNTGPQEVRRGPWGDPHRRRAGGARGEGGAQKSDGFVYFTNLFPVFYVSRRKIYFTPVNED